MRAATVVPLMQSAWLASATAWCERFSLYMITKFQLVHDGFSRHCKPRLLPVRALLFPAKRDPITHHPLRVESVGRQMRRGHDKPRARNVSVVEPSSDPSCGALTLRLYAHQPSRQLHMQDCARWRGAAATTFELRFCGLAAPLLLRC